MVVNGCKIYVTTDFFISISTMIQNNALTSLFNSTNRMHIFPFKAFYPDVQKFKDADIGLHSVRDHYVSLRDKGLFNQLEKEAIFIYRIAGAMSHLGIIAGHDIDDYFQEKILGHENTILEKEQTIFDLTEQNKALTKAILLTYPDQQEINDLMQSYISSHQPLLEVLQEETNEIHTIWKVDTSEITEQFVSLFRQLVHRSYIADGHHRTSMIAQILKKHNSDNPNAQAGLLCAYFPFSALKIYDFSRVVHLDKKFDAKQLIESLGHIFTISLLDSYSKPAAVHELTLFWDNACYQLIWKPNIIEQAKASGLNLDVEIFNTFILKHVLQIPDIQNTPDIEYINGMAPVKNLIKQSKKEGNAVFNFFPLSIEDVVAKSDAGMVLPPKSTWFEPRIKSGLVILEF